MACENVKPDALEKAGISRDNNVGSNQNNLIVEPI
jgi:hypothetical protein